MKNQSRVICIAILLLCCVALSTARHHETMTEKVAEPVKNVASSEAAEKIEEAIDGLLGEGKEGTLGKLRHAVGLGHESGTEKVAKVADFINERVHTKSVEDFERVYGRKPTLAERVQMVTGGSESATRKLMNVVGTAKDVAEGIAERMQPEEEEGAFQKIRHAVFGRPETTTEKVAKGVKDVYEAGKMASNIKEKGKDAADYIGEKAHEAKEAVMGHEPSTMEKIKSMFGSHHETTTEKVARKAGEAYEGAKEAAKETAETIRLRTMGEDESTIDKLKHAVFGRPETTTEKMARKAGEAAEDLKEKSASFGEKIREAGRGLKHAAVDTPSERLSDTGEYLSEKARDLKEKIVGHEETTMEKIKHAVFGRPETTTEKVKRVVSEKAEDVQEAGHGLKEKIKEVIYGKPETTTEKIKHAMEDAADYVSDTAHDVKEKIVGHEETTMEKIKHAVFGRPETTTEKVARSVGNAGATVKEKFMDTVAGGARKVREGAEDIEERAEKEAKKAAKSKH